MIDYKRIFIYVEGLFDEVVLKNILNTNTSDYEVIIKNLGDKNHVLNEKLILYKYYESKAGNDIYFFLPDLHPYNTPFSHNCLEDIRAHVKNFLNQSDNHFFEENYNQKMRFFVFKFNLEVLFLAEINKVFEFIETKGIKLKESINEKYLNEFNKELPEKTEYNGTNHEKRILIPLLKDYGLNYDIVTASNISKNFDNVVLKEKLPHFKDFIDTYNKFIYN